MKLNEKIYYYRKRAKLSQEELAAQVGVSRQAVPSLFYIHACYLPFCSFVGAW